MAQITLESGLHWKEFWRIFDVYIFWFSRMLKYIIKIQSCHICEGLEIELHHLKLTTLGTIFHGLCLFLNLPFLSVSVFHSLYLLEDLKRNPFFNTCPPFSLEVNFPLFRFIFNQTWVEFFILHELITSLTKKSFWINTFLIFQNQNKANAHGEDTN